MNKKMKRKSLSAVLTFLLVVSMLYLPNAVKVAAGSAAVSITESGSWGSGTSAYNMFNCDITNNTGSDITNWKVTVPFGSDATVDQGWCGTFSMSNGTLTITAADSNSTTIGAGNTVSMGFIILNAGSYDLSQAVLTYDGGSTTVTTSPSPSPSAVTSPSPSAAASTTPSVSPSASTTVTASPETTTSSSDSATAVSASTTFTSSTVGSVDLTSIPTVNYKKKDLATSYTDAEVITFTSNAVSYNGSNATVNGSVITITAGGSYVVSGTCNDGQIIVNTEDFVQLVLNGANITCQKSAPIYVQNADKVVVTLAAGSTNTLSDTSSFTYTDAAEEEPNATIFSKDDLTFNGTGSLTVNSNFNNAIQSKDKLKFVQGTYIVNSVADGIKGKDLVGICGGTFTINTSGDGIKSTNEDTDAGLVEITGGNITITAAKDGIQAENYIDIQGGTLNVTTNGGYTNGPEHTDDMGGGGWGWGSSSSTTTTDTESAKGLKSNIATIIAGGTQTFNTSDDAVHGDNIVYIDGGVTNIASGDDGCHADSYLVIDSGAINMTASYEGLEAPNIYLNGGEHYITASDDGVNGNGSSAYVAFNGATLIVDASGDGLDSNGNIVMTAGVVLCSGPTNGGNGALDYDNTFNISGGILVAAGSSGMAMNVSSSSTQPGMLVSYSSAQSANSVIVLRDSSGNDLVAFNPAKEYQTVCISAPGMTVGSTYDLYTGTTSQSTMKQLSTSEYTLGSLIESVTLTSTATGSDSGMGGGPNMGGGFQPGGWGH